MTYHVPDNDDAIDRTYGARPKDPPKPVGNCERCGSDRFVRVFRNGTKVCLPCLDAAGSGPDYDDDLDERLQREV